MTAFDRLLDECHRLFPGWSPEQRARWVKAKLYVSGRHPMPIGEGAIDSSPPDFLRARRPFEPVFVARTGSDVVRDFKAMVERAFRR